MKKYGIAGQATDNYAILRMRCLWRITKAADTHTNTIYNFMFEFPCIIS